MAGKLKKSFDVDLVRAAARGRWPEILSSITAQSRDVFEGKHHRPCPLCQGTDRYRPFDDCSDTGGVMCNKCHADKNGDGFATVQWLLNCNFGRALELIATYLGIDRTATADAPKEKKVPGYPSLFDAITGYRNWILTKRPGLEIQRGALVYEYKQPGGGTNFAVCRYNTNKGKDFCPFHFDGKQWFSGDPKGKLPLFNLPKLADSDHIYIVEGEKAADAMGEIGQVATTSSHGSKSAKRSDWSPLAGKRVTILPDNDTDGERYASDVAAILATLTPPAVVQVKKLSDLPPSGDAFDFIELHRLLDTPDAEIVTMIETTLAEEAKPTPASVIEADDDPHRLARVNLERYATHAAGATLRFWRREWYTWKESRGCYRKIDDAELRAKLNTSIKLEFDRINVERQAEWAAKPNVDEPPPSASKVHSSLIKNVIGATEGMTLIPSSVEMMTWLGDESRKRRSYIATKNGLLDLERLLGDDKAELDDVLLPHSPAWFSVTRLPYIFDPDAKCPLWESHLERCFDLDPERIKLLQEWTGYLLLPITSHQRFAALEGEGANGKSVCLAAIRAILGNDNCSSISVEQLSDKFVRTETLGKLANICPDVGEIQQTNEGNLKAFVSGDVMFFDRKFIKGINCQPTARLMVSFNNRPRFNDKSSGLWRRMLLIPFLHTIPKHERILGMDSTEWWEASGELPGMLNWAIAGLHRLRKQGRFTESKLCEDAVEDYRTESNPARAFLQENLESSESSHLRTSAIYRFYKRWAESHGYRPMGERTFGKEISRVFPKSERKYRGCRGDRYWCYESLRFSQDEICGERTIEETLF